MMLANLTDGALRKALAAGLILALAPGARAAGEPLAGLAQGAESTQGGQQLQLGLRPKQPLPPGALLFGKRGGRVVVLGLAGPNGRLWTTAEGAGTFDPSVDRFAITGCSLGCASSGLQVSCGIVNVFQNADLAVRFSQPVELASALSIPSGFRIFDTQTGVSPSGLFLLDPDDPNTLIFRPNLSFNSAGAISFALESGASYQIEIAGADAGDPGPYLMSVTGAPVANRMLCTITANQGVQDYVPGPPVLALSPPNGSLHVPLDSPIRLVFEDVMNPATVIDFSQGLPPFVAIRENTPGSAPLAGFYFFAIDLYAKTTTLLFTPAQPLPAGTEILVDVQPQVLDLVGNPLANAGAFVFTTRGG